MEKKRSVGHDIALINRYSQIYIAREFPDLGIHGTGQVRIVLTLSNHPEGITQDDLAGELSVDKASVSRMIKPLIENGVAERNVNPNDKRAYIVRLTGNGEKNIPEIRNRLKRWTSVLTEGLDSEETDKLFELFSHLEKNGRHFLRAGKDMTEIKGGREDAGN